MVDNGHQWACIVNIFGETKVRPMLKRPCSRVSFGPGKKYGHTKSIPGRCSSVTWSGLVRARSERGTASKCVLLPSCATRTFLACNITGTFVCLSNDADWAPVNDNTIAVSSLSTQRR